MVHYKCLLFQQAKYNFSRMKVSKTKDSKHDIFFVVSNVKLRELFWTLEGINLVVTQCDLVNADIIVTGATTRISDSLVGTLNFVDGTVLVENSTLLDGTNTTKMADVFENQTLTPVQSTTPVCLLTFTQTRDIAIVHSTFQHSNVSLCVTDGLRVDLTDTEFHVSGMNPVQIYLDSGTYFVDFENVTFTSENYRMSSDRNDFVYEALEVGLLRLSPSAKLVKINESTSPATVQTTDSPPASSMNIEIVPVSIAVIFCFVILLAITSVCAVRKVRSKSAKNMRNEDFDAYLIYSDEEEDFVSSAVVPQLEQTAGLRLIHQRDFVPGSSFVDNIVISIKKSNGTIILFSEALMHGRYFLEEFDMCLAEKEQDPSFVIFVVLMEPTLMPKLSNSMKKKLKHTIRLQRDDPNLFNKITAKLKPRESRRVLPTSSDDHTLGRSESTPPITGDVEELSHEESEDENEVDFRRPLLASRENSQNRKDQEHAHRNTFDQSSDCPEGQPCGTSDDLATRAVAGRDTPPEGVPLSRASASSNKDEYQSMGHEAPHNSPPKLSALCAGECSFSASF